MDRIMRNIYYQGKNLFRDFGFSFWSLIYPLIMAVFFYTAFNGLLNVELKDIKVGIEEGNPIIFALKNIEFLNVEKIAVDDVNKKLDDKEIDGFIDKDLNIKVKESGINQTVIKEIVEEIKQVEKLGRPMEKFDFTKNYIVDKNQKADSVIIIFYSLIAMVSTYGVFLGIEIVSLIQANLSNIGARLNVAPLRKSEFLLAGIIVTLFLNLFSNGILLLFIKYVLKMSLFTELKYSATLIILGNLFGTILGIFIGTSNKANRNTKTLVGIGVTLFLSFLSGMMGPHTKILVDKHVPILGRINPISIITNNLYKVNLLENTNQVSEGILILLAYCIVLTLASYLFLRGKEYDSI